MVSLEDMSLRVSSMAFNFSSFFKILSSAGLMSRLSIVFGITQNVSPSFSTWTSHLSRSFILLFGRFSVGDRDSVELLLLLFDLRRFEGVDIFSMKWAALKNFDRNRRAFQHMTIRQPCSSQSTVVEKLERETRKMNTEINTRDTGLTTLNNAVSALRGEIMAKEEWINNLHMKHLYLESYSRWENLKFFGIPEKEANAEVGGEAFDTRAVLNQFLETVLGFQDPRINIEIQRVHRVGKSNNSKPRPILACSLRFQDRERILRQGFKLKGTEYIMLQDFPQEIIEKRRKMMPKLKEAREKGLRVSFSKSEPDKLIINGKIVS